MLFPVNCYILIACILVVNREPLRVQVNCKAMFGLPTASVYQRGVRSLVGKLSSEAKQATTRSTEPLGSQLNQTNPVDNLKFHVFTNNFNITRTTYACISQVVSLLQT